MTQTIQLAVQKDNVNLINQALNSNQPTKIAAEEGMKISLVEAKTGLPAKKLKAKKVDDDLLIADENGETLLTIEDYYLTDNIQLGTVGDSGFVEFDYVNSETGVTSQIASETSYTTLVSEMLSDTSFIGGISNGVLLGSLGAAALGIAALSSGSSDDSPKTPANKIPVSKNSTIAATEDTIVSGKLEAATDADGDTLTYAIATGAANGKVVIGKDGSYSYTPNANFNGKDSFTYTINDGQGGVITQTATVNVAAVNDAPVSANTTIAATEDTVAKGLLAKATDVDGDALTYVIASAAKNGTAVVNKDGSYSYTPNANFNGKDSFTYTVTDGTETITKTANITVNSFSEVYTLELQETFETTVVSEPQTVVDKQASSFISETITFEITGQNAMPQLELTNGSNVIQGNYSYTIQGPGISSSSNGSISSVGSNSYFIDFSTGTLPPGKYTLDLYVYSSGSSINFNVTEFKDVEKTEFTGYQSVTGNIFADDDGGINAPNGYELQIDGQSLIFQAGSSASSPIVIDTDNGQIELSADGSYVYRSNGNELGLDPTQLAEKFDIKVVDLQGGYVGAYRVNITSDTTPPESGELLFNNFEDTGISQDDGITQDNTFDLTVESNEVGSQVEYQYSTDQGVTWQILANGTASNLADGDYSFRAKVTDEALNESFTAVKDITIDTTAPILGDILNFNTATNQLEVNADIDQDTLQAFKLENGALMPIADASNIPFAEGNYQIKASDVAGNSTTLDFVMYNASEYFESADTIDIVKGSAGNDTIYGGNGDDILIASGGRDTLYGESGNDTLISSGAGDTLWGGEGNDTLIVEDFISSSVNALRGGFGDDIYVINGLELKDVANYASLGNIYINDGQGSNRLDLQGLNVSDLTLSRDDQDLIIQTTGGSVKIISQFNGNGVDNIYFDDGTVWDKADIESMVNADGSSARSSSMSFDEAEDSSDDSGNDYFSESIDLGNDTDTYYDSSAGLPLSFDSSVGQMETLIDSPQIELPRINDLLDLNSNELVFEQADVSNATPSSDNNVISVSKGATDNTAMTVDFAIGQFQDFNDMQTEAMFHIM